MKYIDEFRNNKIAARLSDAIHEKSKNFSAINVMEVCGTHTMSICRYGLRDLLPANITLLSGPGCPVCVTPKSYIDRAIAMAGLKDTIVVTFGDMMRVPGSRSSLMKEKSLGKEVRVVYSPLDALELAVKNPGKRVVFLGIGFETTAPAVASTADLAGRKKINNFFVYSGHKTVLPAMKVLVEDPGVKINGFICPAHVSAITGTRPYDIIVKNYGIPCVVAGFEPLDILRGIMMILDSMESKKKSVKNEYERVVKKDGNKKARNLLDKVFFTEDSEWRGLGIIEDSGMNIRREYAGVDALKRIALPEIETKEDRECICGAILKGIKTPFDCRLFGKECDPGNPQGACMVSSEGACAAYYKYRT